MSLHHRLPLVAALLLASASLAGAQRPDAQGMDAVSDLATSVSAAGSDQATVRPAGGPRLEQARAGVRVVREASAPAVAPQPPITRQRGVPQMIIGGAALLGGAIIGGDAGSIVMLGGLGFGLYGLYLYLQ